ncbi:hypothetical protein [Pararhodospirillum oryzae]|uniref:Uncharacterized protein n=1 Tax=Pararhodospirillum oryzae TaxID=478448 RepID=A0A512H4S5_9PROT|nr:hypothetical protein [Pararhodospirillum oryzae]GEO80441.1 hypothetical protein ROR02_05720 [Pararhodospirillum oryzae]
MTSSLLARARVLDALEHVMTKVGEVVHPATLERRVDASFDPAGTEAARVAVRLLWLRVTPQAPGDPVRAPADRPALILTPDAPAPRPTDRVETSAGAWWVVDAADASGGLGLLFRATLRPLEETGS